MIADPVKGGKGTVALRLCSETIKSAYYEVSN